MKVIWQAKVTDEQWDAVTDEILDVICDELDNLWDRLKVELEKLIEERGDKNETKG